MKFHHIGYLTENLERYLKLSKVKKDTISSFKDNIQQADLHLIKLPDGYIELIVPWDNSELKKELNIKKDGFHHICYIAFSKSEYIKFVKNSIRIAGPYHSVMFKCDIEFYYNSGIIVEIVKSYEK